MKRLLILALCVAGLVLLTAPTAVERSTLTFNGKVMGNMVVLQGGLWGVSLHDFARALGASASLEPTLQLQSNRLFVRQAASQPLKAPQEGTLVPAVNQANAVSKIKVVPGQFLEVHKSGQISSRVTMLNGIAYVPVADIVHAFGDSSQRGTFTGPLPQQHNVAITSVKTSHEGFERPGLIGFINGI